MNKVFKILICIILVLSLFACNKGEIQTPVSESGSENQSEVFSSSTEKSSVGQSSQASIESSTSVEEGSEDSDSSSLDRAPKPEVPGYEPTKNSITVDKIKGAEYRISGGEWQIGNVFSGLDSNTEYKIELRIKAVGDLRESEIVTLMAKTLRLYDNYNFAFDRDLKDSGISKSTSIYALSGTDDFSRNISPVTGAKTDKKRYTGIFYFTWHGQHGGQQSGIYDITRLLNENPDALWSTTRNAESPTGQYHFWGEPLYGYYNSLDPWVIRRHIELLTFAGIDFLVLDATNGFEYFQVADVMFPILQEYYDKGWNVPKIVYYCNSSSNNVVRNLYEGVTSDPNATGLKKTGIYKGGYYEDLWFKPNGKPFIIAVTKTTNRSAGWENGNNDLHRVKDTDLLNFFEFKESQWPTVADDIKDGFPWIDFRRPQVSYTDVINVGVAQHNRLPFSDALLNENVASQMWGRGFTSVSGANHTENAVRSGLNFEEQWKIAIQRDLKYTFITGWNEWTAIKFVGQPNPQIPGNPVRTFFVDTVNEEFSRDVEMMKGGYKDNFYLQLVRNIRDLKMSKMTQTEYETSNTIDIRKGLSQWDNIKSVYYGFTGKGNRNFTNFSRTAKYTDNSLINDIEEIRVTHDNINLYYLIKTTKEINVNLSSEKFMNLMIDVDGYKNKPFLGYDYLINRKPDKYGLTSIEEYGYERGNYNFKNSGDAEFTVYGKYMQIKIPRSAIGISGRQFRVDFQIADNVTDMLDSQKYYITGSVVPSGTFRYAYYGK